MKKTQTKLHFFYSVSLRLLLFLIIWIVLTNGNMSSLWIGLPAAVVAAATSTTLIPPLKWNFNAFVKFIPFFFKYSLIGGLDVMWRAFHPTLPINPDLVRYRLSIPEGFAQDMMVDVISLLPGTLSVEVEDTVLSIHILNVENDIQRVVSLIESHLSEIFCLNIGNKGEKNEKI